MSEEGQICVSGQDRLAGCEKWPPSQSVVRETLLVSRLSSSEKSVWHRAHGVWPEIKSGRCYSQRYVTSHAPAPDEIRFMDVENAAGGGCPHPARPSTRRQPEDGAAGAMAADEPIGLVNEAPPAGSRRPRYSLHRCLDSP